MGNIWFIYSNGRIYNAAGQEQFHGTSEFPAFIASLSMAFCTRGEHPHPNSKEMSGGKWNSEESPRFDNRRISRANIGKGGYIFRDRRTRVALPNFLVKQVGIGFRLPEEYHKLIPNGELSRKK